MDPEIGLSRHDMAFGVQGIKARKIDYFLNDKTAGLLTEPQAPGCACFRIEVAPLHNTKTALRQDFFDHQVIKPA